MAPSPAADTLARFGPLFAVLDAAQDDKVRELLAAGPDEVRSLYDEPAAREWEAVAPYLVRFGPASPLLPRVVAAGWGKSWGIFLSSSEPFDAVRRQLRRFLFVLDGSRRVYFRYYDPRVLRHFLPACTLAEYQSFFGPITDYLIEGREPRQVVRFRAGSTPGAAETIAVTAARPPE
jgi:hypothetical protein